MRLILLVCLCAIIPLTVPAKDFNILDFGAVGDGKSLSTEAIQAAVDKAHKKKGVHRVIVPEGRFLTGAIRLKSGVILHVEKEGVLLGSTLPEHYFKINRWRALIMADSAFEIGITGEGTIDGQGRQAALHLDSLFYAGQLDSADYNFVERRPKYYMRPQLIEFVRCTDILVQDITLKNAACWVQTQHECRRIVIDNVKTISDAYWNNDGIDIQDCVDVRITNCFVNSADDGICLKSHGEGQMCGNIYIDNCTVRSSASAVKFGTRSHGGFSNITIKNIKVYDTFRSAIAIECVDGAVLENVRIDSVEAENTGNAIFIRLGQRYAKTPSVLKDVWISNVKVDVAFMRPDYDYEIRGPALPFFHNTFPSSITGVPGHPVQNVTLENIEINYPGRGNKGLAYFPLSRLEEVPEKVAKYPEFSMFGELPAWGFYVRHVEGLTLKNIKLSIEQADYRPAFVFDDVKGLQVKGLEIEGERKEKHIILHNTEDVEIEDEKGVVKQK